MEVFRLREQNKSQQVSGLHMEATLKPPGAVGRDLIFSQLFVILRIERKEGREGGHEGSIPLRTAGFNLCSYSS